MLAWVRRSTHLHGLPNSVVRRLVEALFAEDSRLLFGSVLLVLAALLAYARTSSSWFLVWGFLSVPLAFWRLRVGLAFRQASDTVDLHIWIARALVGAWLTGALWGAASIVLVIGHDPFVQFLIVVCQTAFVTGGAVRNSSVPAVARGQTLLASGPLVVCLLASGDVYFRLFSAFAVFNIVTTMTIIRSVHRQIVAVLVSEGEKAAVVAELTEVNHDLERMASTDALTRVLNRRGLDVRLSQEWRRAAREETTLSVLMLDVDRFKLFNDRYGHQMGDDCLYKVAQGILEGSRRPADIVCRYGGEEFAVVLPNTDARGALHVAGRIRETVEALDIPHTAQPGGRVTISIGCATDHPTRGSDPVGIVYKADEALFRAKREGRNRVVSHREGEPGLEQADLFLARPVEDEMQPRPF